MESIDKIGQHEKFLAKNFESLDGGDDHPEGAGESPNGKNRYRKISPFPNHQRRFNEAISSLAVVIKMPTNTQTFETFDLM